MRRMQITLSAEQTANLLEATGKLTAAELNADCEPSGYALNVSITGAGCWVEALIGGQEIDLGDVAVTFIDEGSR